MQLNYFFLSSFTVVSVLSDSQLRGNTTLQFEHISHSCLSKQTLIFLFLQDFQCCLSSHYLAWKTFKVGEPDVPILQVTYLKLCPAAFLKAAKHTSALRWSWTPRKRMTFYQPISGIHTTQNKFCCRGGEVEVRKKEVWGRNKRIHNAPLTIITSYCANQYAIIDFSQLTQCSYQQMEKNTRHKPKLWIWICYHNLERSYY